MRRPVRIKYYGMFWMTKRTYLTITLTLCAIVFVLMIWVATTLGDHLPPFSTPWDPRPPNLPPGWRGAYYHHFWSIILVLCLCEVLDVLIVLRKFAEKEAEQVDDDEDY